MSIDDVLAQARRGLERLYPDDAQVAAREGAVLVDIRPAINRELEGEIPGALWIDRNVLEWRLDPAADSRIQQASYDAQIIVFCNEGYASSLAARSLRDLGITAATDMVGGFRLWQALGLPVTAPFVGAGAS
jgi:rhodanese-related sulfurtransferase